MGKKKEGQTVSVPNPNTLSGFISGMSSNIGFSPIQSSDKNTKKEKYNPFSVDNTKEVTELYNVMKEYKNKTSATNTIIPTSASKTPSGKKTKFEFGVELKENIFNKIVEQKGLTNISLDESNKKIEITK